MMLCALVLVELIDVFGWLGAGIPIGDDRVSWTLIPAVALCPFLVRSVPGGTWRSSAAGGVLLAVTVASCLLYPVASLDVSLFEVFVTAWVEEVAFRLAIPLLVLVALRQLGVRRRNGLIVGCAVSVVLFTLLPGHVAQFRDGLTPFVFVAFALVTTYVVWRGGLLWPAICAHITVDVLALEMAVGAVSNETRVIGTGLALLLMILVAIDRLRVREETAIDLRDGSATTVEQVEPVERAGR
jgi:hypothetical protein